MQITPNSPKSASTPKLTVRRADERGRAEHGWLHARFTFSFAEYFDPDHMGFRSLRVMNNDRIDPGGGFPSHPHHNMEIFTYVIEGELEHKDSMGNGSVIKAGDLQYMSAGSGVTHSEFNPSRDQSTQLYQIWLQPNETDGEPRYAEKPLSADIQATELKLLFSGDGRDGTTAIRQDAEIYFGNAESGGALQVPESESTPHVWLQVIEGKLAAFGESLATGDGIAAENAAGAFEITADAETKFLLFRLA